MRSSNRELRPSRFQPSDRNPGTVPEKPCKNYWIVEIRGGTAVANEGSFELKFMIDNQGTHELNFTMYYDDSVASVTERLQEETEMLANEALICRVLGGEFPVNAFIFANKNSNSPYLTSVTTRISDASLPNGTYPHVTMMLPIEVED